jgi:O-methyltransferase
MNNKILANTIVAREKLESIKNLLAGRDVKTIAEVGVYRGGAALLLHELFPDAILYLCDTFNGIPYHSKEDNHHKTGDFGDTSIDHVRSLFTSNNVEIIKGIFPASASTSMGTSRFDVVHLDVDVYIGYVDSLEYFSRRMAENSIIFLDDYGLPTCEGATLAVNEFLQRNQGFEMREFSTQYYLTKK